MIPDVAVPSYDQAFGSLGNIYDPQRAQVETEIAQLAPAQAAQQAGLDQAKVNAFRDITTAANSKGMLFSGFSPDQQAQYVGTKYLPAVANLKTSFQNSRNTLQDKINQINTNRANQAQGIVSSAQTAAANAAFKNAQLQISARASASARSYGGSSGGSRGSAGSAGKNPSINDIIGFYKNAQSNYGSYNPNGTNYHRWAAAEQALKDANLDPNQYKKQLAAAFGSAADKKQYGVTGY